MPAAHKLHSISISAAHFVSYIETARREKTPYLGLFDAEVAGDVDLSGEAFQHGLEIEGVTFRDAVRLRNCAFHAELRLKGCSFNGSLDMSNARLDLGLKILDCRFGLEDVALASTALTLDGAKVSGDVRLDETAVNGLLSALRLKVKGDVSFHGCTIDGDSGGIDAVANFASANVSGSIVLDLGGASGHRSVFDSLQADAGTFRATRRTVIGDRSGQVAVSLRNARATNVLLNVVHVVGALECDYLRCSSFASGVSLFASRPGDKEHVTGATFGGAVVEGNLVLSGGNYGFIRLQGITISGSVVMIDGKSGQIDIEDGVGEGFVNAKKQPVAFVLGSRLGNFFMSSWHCHDYLRLHPERISGKKDQRGWNGIYILSSQIDRRLSLWPGHYTCNELQGYFTTPPQNLDRIMLVLDADQAPVLQQDPRCQLPLNRWARRMSVRGKVNLKHCAIGEDLILTGIDVRDPESPGNGRIEVLQCTVKGNVKFDSPMAHLSDPERDNAALLLLAQYLVVTRLLPAPDPPTPLPPPGSEAEERWEDAVAGFARARCDGVEFSDLIAEKVELSGLRIRGRILTNEEREAWAVTESARIRRQLFALRGRSAAEVKPVLDELARVNSIDGERFGVALQSAEIKRQLSTFARLSAIQVELALDEVGRVVAAEDWQTAQRASLAPFPAELLPSRPEYADHRRKLLVDCFGDAAIEAVLQCMRLTAMELETCAVILGALNLEHATIDELRVSDSSFSDRRPRSDAARNGIVLSHAKLDTLYVARRDRAANGKPAHSGFPVPLNLLDVEVRRWFLESGEDLPRTNQAFIGREATDPNAYLDLLDSDPIFRMSSYLAIERSLRNRGLEKEATRIYIAGIYRDTRTGASGTPGTPAEILDENARAWRQWLWRARQVVNWRPGWWFQTLVWRPGDGRYRREDALSSRVIKAVLVALIGLGIFSQIPRTPFWVAAGIVAFTFITSLVFRASVPLFRLVRPNLESASILVGVATILLGLIIFFGFRWDFPLFDFLGYMIVGYLLFQTPARVFGDHLFWSMSDYGTGATRLAIVIGVLMLASFVLATDTRNFEPTLAARTEQSERDLARAALSVTHATAGAGQAEAGNVERKWDDNLNPKSEYWPIGEKIWMTLRFHVPLVDAVVAEEWQPSIRPMRIRFLSPDGSGDPRPIAWPYSSWPRARDWFGAMLWLNWILWPLFLPFLIRRFTRAK